jgi:small subunit ribosomal protein S1
MTAITFTNEPIILDEGWWAAIMHEAEAHPSARRAGAALGGERDSQSAWQIAREHYDNDQLVELVVTGYNRGGLLVSFNALPGFIPASHLVNFPIHGDDETRATALAQRVGQHLSAKVIEHDPVKSRVVFSERAAQSGSGARHTVLSALRVGAVVTGVITNLCDFGAFVDLGGVEGLIHVSEVAWGRVAHPRDVLRCNQTVQVQVMAISAEQNRVALSLKRLTPDPWAAIEQRYRAGQLVEGVVSHVVNFGAFVHIEDGLEGLIHVSELAEGPFLHPRNVVREGETVRASVVFVDGRARRLSLSLRRAARPTNAQAA